MGLINAIFENMQGRLDQDLPTLLQFCVEELSFVTSLKESKQPQMYKSMVLQAIAMSFTCNATIVFQVLQSSGTLGVVMQTWFKFMNDFKKDFELRRNIFGLCAIIKTPNLPELVSSRIPDIVNQLTLLTQKMHTDRLETLKENEEELKNGGDFDSDSDQGNDVGDENANDMEEEANSDEEWDNH